MTHKKNIEKMLVNHSLNFTQIVEDTEDIGYFIYSSINYENEPVFYCQVYKNNKNETEYILYSYSDNQRGELIKYGIFDEPSKLKMTIRHQIKKYVKILNSTIHKL